MAATPSGSPLFQGIDPDTGLPLAGGRLYTYAAGTTDPLETWADAAQAAENTNPIILDAAGQAWVYISGAYKFVLHDSLGNLLWEVDDILGGSDAFIRPASGVSSLPFDDIEATNVQAALEELGSKRIKTDDTVLLATLLAAYLPQPGDFKWSVQTTDHTGWLRCDGSNKSRSAYPALFALLVTAQGFTAQTFTVTIASPGVVTKTGHGLNTDDRLRLTTTGALPTGLAAGSEYFVKKIDANTFNLAATPGGTSIVTTGTQSGVHSYTKTLFGLGDGSTTFTLPDDSDVFVRGLAAGKTLGATHPETVGPHTHGGTTGNDSPIHTHSTSESAYYGANTNSNRGYSAGDLQNGAYGAVTGGPNVNHQHPFSTTTQTPTAVENVPKNMGLCLFIKT